MKYKPGHFKKLLKESLTKNLNEQGTGICLGMQMQNPELYDYCYTHCPSVEGLPECDGAFGEMFADTCCPDDPETGCPEGMIDDTSPLWGDCVKCWTTGEETINTGEDCECCRPMEDEVEEEKLTCYRCKKGTQNIQTIQFPNSLSSWSWFNFQGECPKGWTTNPDPCSESNPGTAGMGLPPRTRRRR